MKKLLIFVALLLNLPAIALASAPDDRLGAGEVIVTPTTVAGFFMPRLTVQFVVDAAPEKVWKIVSDCSNYPKSMPRVKKTREVLRQGNRTHCEMTIDMPFPFEDLQDVSAHNAAVTPGRWHDTFTLLTGDYVKKEGSWTLTPFDDQNKRTRVVYVGHSVPITRVPDGMMRRGQMSAMRDMVDLIRKQF